MISRSAASAILCLALAAPLGADGVHSAPRVTFGQDVWPVLQKRCITCHQPGAIAPMSFTSYVEVRPWARAIRQAVISGSMPPWHAAAGSAHAFRNDRSLSREEISAITRWVDSGCPEGNTAGEKFVPVAEHGWRLGKPDLVLQVPGLHVPKTGVMPYTFLIVPLHFEHDTWVRAAEFHIDQRGLVHHINAFVRPPGSSYLGDFPVNKIFVPTVADRGRKRAGEAVFARRQLLLGYEPGYDPMPWLEDGAKLIPAGSDIVFEMHFNPNGHEATDNSELGLYFAKAAPAQRVLAIDTLRDLDLAIPPQSSAYVSHASMTLGRPARLLSIQPHMHVRGKSMEVKARFPDGRVETLLSVPKYDFNWQTTYVLREPLELP
ncbi:MAG TPA: cytochrome c, partial [Bryobacteraceae bacterium]|nr:cytochrome c [Bryobacteraceae bacterium]